MYADNDMNERLKILFQKYYDQTASEQEVIELRNMLKHVEDEKQLATLITDSWNNLSEIHPHFAVVNNNGLDKILKGDPIKNTPAFKPVHRVHFLKTAWFRYAAAIIILFGIGAYLWNTHINPNPSSSKN